jgi:hypothetical protein
MVRVNSDGYRVEAILVQLLRVPLGDRLASA